MPSTRKLQTLATTHPGRHNLPHNLGPSASRQPLKHGVFAVPRVSIVVPFWGCLIGLIES